MLGSQTQNVLQRPTIPVLVASVESNVPALASDAPLAIIRDEHRSLAAVIHGLEFLVREARDSRHAAIVPAAARDACITSARFRRRCTIRRKTRTSSASCARGPTNSTRRSTSSSASTSRARSSSRRSRTPSRATRPDPAAAFAAFAEAVQRFATAQMEHMGLEAKVIIPAARAHLTAEDWQEIGDAFGANGDPRFSVDADEEYRQLFARILNLAPEGVVGEPARAAS